MADRRDSPKGAALWLSSGSSREEVHVEVYVHALTLLLLTLLPHRALRADVPVERHRPDAELAAQLGHRRVAVRHRGLGQPHLGLR